LDQPALDIGRRGQMCLVAQDGAGTPGSDTSATVLRNGSVLTGTASPILRGTLAPATLQMRERCQGSRAPALATSAASRRCWRRMADGTLRRSCRTVGQAHPDLLLRQPPPDAVAAAHLRHLGQGVASAGGAACS